MLKALMLRWSRLWMSHVQLCTSSVGERNSLEVSDRGGGIPDLLLIVMRRAVNPDLLCSH